MSNQLRIYPDLINENNIICWNDPRYLESINFNFRDQIYKYDPIKFRKTVKVLQLKLERVQLEFCEGKL